MLYKDVNKKGNGFVSLFISSDFYLGSLPGFQNLNHQLNKRKNCNNFPAQY